MREQVKPPVSEARLSEVAAGDTFDHRGKRYRVLSVATLNDVIETVHATRIIKRTGEPYGDVVRFYRRVAQ